MNTIEEIINDLYYNLKTINDKKIIDQISSYYKLFPLYDIYTENIILVRLNELYDRLINYHFRPIKDLSILKNEKHINFMKNFNLELLYKTFLENIYNKSKETGELTNCLRPSFLPIFRYITPYYSKTELIYMALNMGLWEDGLNVETVCKNVSDNDIVGDKLLEHQLFIRENYADYYIKYYSFLGSGIFNYYLRFPWKNNRDTIIEQHINNFRSILIKSPSWNKSYIFYRWISQDDFLRKFKINDIWEEYGFLSTTRQAFVDPEKNYFGYILVKIRVPANVQGCGLAIEYYSHFPEEQEIIFAPSKFKLVNTANTKYYHPNPVVKDKIVSKYEFEWIGHINEYIRQGYLEKTYINTLNFDDKLYGNKIDDFYSRYYNKFYSKIGNANILFYIAKIEQGPYDLFFYSNLIQDNDNNGIFITWQNNETGEINLFIEISNIISVNYYNKFNPSETKILDDYTYDDIIQFIKNLGNLFEIDKIIIHSDHKKYFEIINFNDYEIDTFHKKQLYISDCFYFNQILMNYITEFYMIKYNSSKFIQYLIDKSHENNFKLSIGINTIKIILDTDLIEFINEYNKPSYINDPLIDQIFKIANKIYNKKESVIKELNNIKKTNIKIIPGNKIIDLYIYLFYNYYYLIPYLHGIIFEILNIDFNDIYFNISNQKDTIKLNLNKIIFNKRLFTKKTQINRTRFKLDE